MLGDNNRVVLQPAYMKYFHCIGSACEDSCCIGWRVNLDKKTYKTYKKLRDKELKPMIQKMVKRKHNQKTDAAYGHIKMEPNGRCPFLNEENLCKIYMQAGEQYLSDTCTFYPRHTHKVDGGLERSATMSCPEAARLGLLNPDGIVFEQSQEDQTRMKIHHLFDTEGHLYLEKPQRYFWDIRMFSLSLLQDRNYSLAERLIILGIVYKRTEGLCQKGLAKDIPAMLEKMKRLIEPGSLKDEVAKVPANTQIQMRLAKELTDKKVLQGITSPRYLECLREALLGIDYKEEEEQLANILQKYQNNYNEYLAPYLKEKEYILENYLVNEYFRELMPFGSFKTIWDSYIFLCVLYSMIKLHLIGMGGHHKGLNDDLTLKLIQSFSKVVLHNSQYIQGIIRLLKDNGYDSLAYMSILVKN